MPILQLHETPKARQSFLKHFPSRKLAGKAELLRQRPVLLVGKISVEYASGECVTSPGCTKSQLEISTRRVRCSLNNQSSARSMRFGECRRRLQCRKPLHPQLPKCSRKEIWCITVSLQSWKTRHMKKHISLRFRSQFCLFLEKGFGIVVSVSLGHLSPC